VTTLLASAYAPPRLVVRDDCGATRLPNRWSILSASATRLPIIRTRQLFASSVVRGKW